MNIGINGERILLPNPAGPEIYTINIIKALGKIDHENKYTIYFNQKPSEEFFSNLVSNNPNFKYKVLKRFLSWTQISLAIELLLKPVDVFFTAVHTMPIFHFVKVVVMIHGLEYKYASSGIMSAAPVWFTSKFSNKVIVPSEYTKKQLLQKNWGIKQEKIKVIPEAVSSEFYKRSSETKPYFLFISTIEPRKNLPKLIEAFSLVVKKHPQYKLYIAGKKGWDYTESMEAPAKFGLQENVEFLGRVSQEQLPILLSESTAFVSTSLEEGFGLPLLEAMASEVPCVVSDIEAFRSIGKDYVTYVNPNSVEDISQKLLNLLSDYPTPKQLNEAGDYAKSFTWEKAAQETLNSFKVI